MEDKSESNLQVTYQHKHEWDNGSPLGCAGSKDVQHTDRVGSVKKQVASSTAKPVIRNGAVKDEPKTNAKPSKGPKQIKGNKDATEKRMALGHVLLSH